MLLSAKVSNRDWKKTKTTDMVMCVGDKRSAEDMFERILSSMTNPD